MLKNRNDARFVIKIFLIIYEKRGGKKKKKSKKIFVFRLGLGFLPPNGKRNSEKVERNWRLFNKI